MTTKWGYVFWSNRN